MRIRIKHAGYLPHSDEHMYHILCDNGHADIIYEHTLNTDEYMDSDDRLWDPANSGWVDVSCDGCGYTYRERVYYGLTVHCPVCDTPETIPKGAILDEFNCDD